MVKQNEIFQIGESVWYATTNRTSKHVPCPVCYGKKEVTVILGNGEEIITPCRYCDRAFAGPSGWVEGDWEWTAEARLGTITSMRSDIDEFGELSVVYYFSGNGHNHDSCSRTRDGALALSMKHCLEWQAKEDLEKSTYVKKYGYRDYSYNAGYHRREAERAYSNYLYHLDHAHHFEEKARPRDAKDKHK